jgi:hypothetical protein
MVNSSSRIVVKVKIEMSLQEAVEVHKMLPHFMENELTDGSEFVTLMFQLPFPPGRFLVLISVTD